MLDNTHTIREVTKGELLHVPILVEFLVLKNDCGGTEFGLLYHSTHPAFLIMVNTDSIF